VLGGGPAQVVAGRQARLGLRREHQDLLSQRAAVHHVRPHDAGERAGEVVARKRVLGDRDQLRFGVHLVGELGLAREQLGRRDQREELRRLVPPAARHELLDLAGHGEQVVARC
jgi:hypothetical protein